jgi:hypothetical protein
VRAHERVDRCVGSGKTRAALANVWDERGHEDERSGTVDACSDGPSVAVPDDDRPCDAGIDRPLNGAGVGCERTAVQTWRVNDRPEGFEGIDEWLHVGWLMVKTVHQHDLRQ